MDHLKSFFLRRWYMHHSLGALDSVTGVSPSPKTLWLGWAIGYSALATLDHNGCPSTHLSVHLMSIAEHLLGTRPWARLWEFITG